MIVVVIPMMKMKGKTIKNQVMMTMEEGKAKGKTRERKTREMRKTKGKTKERKKVQEVRTNS
jgi:hypothetical protein